MFADIVWPEIWQATLATLYMVGLSTLMAAVIGLPLGVLLLLWSKGNLLENKWAYQILSVIVNIVRSVPFIILLIAIIPVTE